MSSASDEGRDNVNHYPASSEEMNQDDVEVIPSSPRRECRTCHTPLVLGENWIAYRQRTGHYICNTCYSEYQKEYRQGNIHSLDKMKKKESWHSRKVDELASYWNSSIYSATTPAMRIVEIFRARGITKPCFGFTQEEMVDVLFSDDLVFDMLKEIDDYIKRTNLRGFQKVEVKSHLNEFMSNFEEEIRVGKKQKAIHRFNHLVDQVNNLYDQQEELCAKPAFMNKDTGHNEHRYYLLTHEDELKPRITMRKGMRQRLMEKDESETRLVNRKEQEISKTQSQQSDSHSESQNSSNTDRVSQEDNKE